MDIQKDEYLDLVDADDNVISLKKRSEIYAEHLSNFRVINSFIVNSKGELWIPRRTSDKFIFPSCLDMSIGGHVKSGESYEMALRREALEELNIDIDKVNLRLLGYLTPQQDSVSAFMSVYEIRMDNLPDYNKNDFSEFYWLSPDKLLHLIEKGEKTKEDLPKLVKKFYIK